MKDDVDRLGMTQTGLQPVPVLESAWSALLASGQGFGIVDLIPGVNGEMSDFR